MTQKNLRIALIGYGKMGKTIETIAKSRGHEVPVTFSSKNLPSKKELKKAKVDVAIEFTRPGAAVNNILHCLDANVPVAVGTTGWMSELKKIKKACKEENGKVLYASNFSVGVNILFEINRKLAKMMNAFPEYAAEIEEVHHTEKLDEPSGTAISLADGILKNMEGLDAWTLGDRSENSLPIFAEREGDVKGIHHVSYTSEIDRITIGHEAFTRDGFAVGAVLAAEFLAQQKSGVYTMRDYFKSL